METILFREDFINIFQVNYGIERDWSDNAQGQGQEFLYHSTQCKNIWMPMGSIYANQSSEKTVSWATIVADYDILS